MSDFGRFDGLFSRAVDRHLSDCTVTLGRTIGWASRLRAPQSGAVFDNAANLAMPGLFEDYFQPALETESRIIAVEIESLVPLDVSGYADVELRHDDRVLIYAPEKFASPFRWVHEIRRIEPSATGRTLLYLHTLGPLCGDDVEDDPGFPYQFPVRFRGALFASCAQLDIAPRRGFPTAP